MKDIKKYKRVHLIGIGGIGVSAIAEILLKKGHIVSGSDLNPSNITKKLEEKACKIDYCHQPTNVEKADLVVYTAAANSDNPELLRATQLGIPIVTRAEMLGYLMDQYKKSVAIAGVHGKTTTTSMLSSILYHAGVDPTLLIGGELAEINGNARFGDSDFFVTEACEYRESFLNFRPEIAVVLNIDEDHLDYYRDLNHIIDSFIKFTKNMDKKGTLVINGDDYNAMKIAETTPSKVVTFGINKDTTYKATNIIYSTSGFPTFDVMFGGKVLANIRLKVPGQHNIYNALAAFAVASIYKIDLESTVHSLSEFTGAKRRFDKLGEYNGASIIDDYAHHPSEIKATLSAAKRIEHGRTICIFQPHTYTRTKELINEFATAFANADKVIITDIYASREKDLGLIHSRDLVKKIRDAGYEAEYISSFEEIVSYLKSEIQSKDIVFTMGAGNIYEVAHQLLV